MALRVRGAQSETRFGGRTGRVRGALLVAVGTEPGGGSRAATEDQTACSAGASALGRQGVILRARRKLLGVPPLPAGSSLGYRHQRLKLTVRHNDILIAQASISES